MYEDQGAGGRPFNRALRGLLVGVKEDSDEIRLQSKPGSRPDPRGRGYAHIGGVMTSPFALTGEPTGPDGPELARLAQEGDQLALAQLFERSLGSIYLQLLSRFDGDAHEAEEALQETTARAVHQLASYRPEVASFFTWLASIAHNQATDRLRALSRIEPMPPALVREKAEADPILEAVSDRYFREDIVLPQIRVLPRLQRTALFMKYAGGLSSKQIAAILDRAPEAIRMAESRGLSTLRAREQRLIDGAGAREARAMRRLTSFSPVISARRAFVF